MEPYFPFLNLSRNARKTPIPNLINLIHSTTRYCMVLKIRLIMLDVRGLIIPTKVYESKIRFQIQRTWMDVNFVFIHIDNQMVLK